MGREGTRNATGNPNVIHRASFLAKASRLLASDRSNLLANNLPLSRYYCQNMRRICLKSQIRMYDITSSRFADTNRDSAHLPDILISREQSAEAVVFLWSPE